MLAAAEDQTRPSQSSAHALQQASFYDEPDDAEWEISRPRTAPRLYRWMLKQKIRRSLRGLESLPPGATVLTVCGGSGMEADFLAQTGALVVSSDISLGAARRAKVRAECYGISIIPLVASADQLPFADHTIDLVYVHDGLHHTAAPEVVVHEMARVARLAVSITEPAQALLTEMAMRLGLSPDYAAAGNRIVRLAVDDVEKWLVCSGLTIHRSARYLMYYKWRPGRYMELLSSPVLYPLSRATLLLANLLIGRWGNKFVVTASYSECASTCE